MKSILFVLLFCVITQSLFAQSYSYSFEGIADPSILNQIEKNVLMLPDVSSCKLKIKDGTDKAELFIFLKKKDASEVGISFSPIDVKNIIIELGLSPLNFIKLID